MDSVYAIHLPQTPLPLVFDSPHSGRTYPADFGYACPFDELEKAEDNFVDELFASAPTHGATLLTAHFPRSYIDVNRAVDDIDPELLSEDWPHGAISPSIRSDAGIGLIRRLCRPGVPVYDRALSPQEILARIETCYRPYHTALGTILDTAHYNFGEVWHINCHSMPAVSAKPRRATGLTAAAPDFVLGDRDGNTCATAFTHLLRDILRGMSYSVAINDPFRGVELVRRYSNPARGRHSLQIEINKALYMDEETGAKTTGFKKLKADMDALSRITSGWVQERLMPLAAD